MKKKLSQICISFQTKGVESQNPKFDQIGSGKIEKIEYMHQFLKFNN